MNRCMHRVVVHLVVSLCSSLSLVACRGGGDGAGITDVPVALVTVDPSTSTVLNGQTVSLTATVLGKLGALTSPDVTWTSDNTSIVAVPATGVTVMATARAVGTATIHASSGGQNGTATITVTNVPVASLLLADHAVSVAMGATYQLTAQPRDAGGAALASRQIVWASTNSGVATVDGTGMVAAISVGVASVIATCEGRADTAVVTVIPPPVNSVTVAPSALNVIVGNSAPLQATTLSAAGAVLTGRVITWASSNSSIASVSPGGVVGGAAVGGPVTITATSEGKSGTATVQVVPVPIASIALTPSPVSLVVGQATMLAPTAKDSAGNTLPGRVFTWTSSDATVASVSSAGLVTGIKVGTATITASAEGKSGTATVTVEPAPPPTATLTVQAVGSGSGAITSAPAGVNCVYAYFLPPGVCVAAFPVGTAVTLTAVTYYGTSFDGWGGACASNGTNATCQLTMSTSLNVSGTLTDRLPPYPTTGAATAVTATSATLNGCVNAVTIATSGYFQWSYSSDTGQPPVGSVNVPTDGQPHCFQYALTGLPSGVKIYYVAGVRNSWGVRLDTVNVTFTTLQVPTATTNAATSVSQTAGTLNGCTIGVSIATQVWFQWGTTTSFGSQSAMNNQATDNTSYCWSLGLTGLTHATTYYFRILASNANGQSTGSTLSFTTPP